MKTQVRSTFIRNDRINNLEQIKTTPGLWVGPPNLSDRVGLHRIQPGEIGVYEFEYSADGKTWRRMALAQYL